MTRRVLIAVLVAPLVLLVALVVGHGRLVGLVLEHQLEDRGIHCSGLSVALGWNLRTGHVADATCDLDEGPVASASVVGPMAIELPGVLALPPRAVRLPAITLNPRDLGEGDDPGALGLAVLAGDVPPRLGEALLALGQLSAEPELPDVDVDQISIGRGRVLLLDRVAVRRSEGALRIDVASIGPPPRSAAPLSFVARLEEVSVRASDGAVDVDGALTIEAEAGGRAHAVLLDVERRVPFHIESRGTTNTLRLDDDGAVARLRERLATVAEGEGRLGELLRRLRPRPE